MKSAPSPVNPYEHVFRTRTRLAIDFHKMLEGTQNYIYKTKDGREWHWVRKEINFAEEERSLWVSMGSSSGRENLLFDTNSPHIQQIRTETLDESRGKNVKTILETVNGIINHLTEIEGTSTHVRERAIDDELDYFLKNAVTLDITMDELIDKKLLVCRHKALIAAFLLGELVKANILPAGEVYQYRTELHEEKREHKFNRRELRRKPSEMPTQFNGVHCWANYLETSGNQTSWMCDPRWRMVLDLEKDIKIATQKYGKPTILNMVHHIIATIDKAKPEQHTATSPSTIPSIYPTPVHYSDPPPDQMQIFELPPTFVPMSQRAVLDKMEKDVPQPSSELLSMPRLWG